VEAQENPKDDTAIEEGHERIWAFMNSIGTWLGRKKPAWSRGEIRVGEGESASDEDASRPELAGPQNVRQRARDAAQDSGLELEDR
jgi:hypothetical protein